MDPSENIETDYLYMQKIIATLYNTSKKIKKRTNSVLSDLSMDELMMICTIVYSKEAELEVSSLSQRMGLTLKETRNILSGLRNKMYVESVTYTSDKRKRRVELTENGYNAMLSSGKRMNQLIEPLIKNFTSRELTDFFDYLQRIYLFEEEEYWDYEENYSDKADPMSELIAHKELLKEFTEIRNKT